MERRVLNFSRLAGFERIGDQVAGELDFREEAVGAVIGAKIGAEPAAAPDPEPDAAHG